MTSLSACTIVRNGVKLAYPLEASILSYYPICDEIVLAYDPTSEDETEKHVKDLARRYPKIRPLPSPWNMDNHTVGTEIAVQSNVAWEACAGDWILYVQADEAIHEGDHAALREALTRTDINGILFDRRSFMGMLDSEVPEYYVRGLLRLLRNGTGCVVGDGTTCRFMPSIQSVVPSWRFRMFNYSRMGGREEILLRARHRDRFYHDTEQAIEKNLQREFTQLVQPFDATTHPAAIREWYRSLHVPAPVKATQQPPVSLCMLLAEGEREHVIPFFWSFRGWPGEVVVVDDMTSDGGPDLLRAAARMAGIDERWVRICRRALDGDFGAARNFAHQEASSFWVLHADPDERWDGELMRNLPALIRQLDRDGKDICGFPRANFLEGVLVNDLPDSEWTEDGLKKALASWTPWPPRYNDIQYRLMRRRQRWQGRIHEVPTGVLGNPDQVVSLRDHWILHHKSLDRQRRQDLMYKSLGQSQGMPQAGQRPAEEENLREKVLREAAGRLPPGRIVIVETGTLRDPSPKARFSDGWSTWCLAQLVADRGDTKSRVYSIDLDPKGIEISRRTVPEPLRGSVTWVCDESRKALASLEEERIDLLYLDSGDDPRLILEEFETALPKLAPHGIVVVDDTGSYSAGLEGKGTLLLPEAVRRGWRLEHRRQGQCRMSILTRPPDGERDSNVLNPLRAELPDLSTVNGFLSDEEAAGLFTYARNASEGVLEIGTYFGKSTIALAAGRKAAGKSPVFTVDHGRGSVEHEGKIPREGTWPIALRNFERLGVKNFVVPIMMDSLQARRELDDRWWSFIFIDGSHDRLSVLTDAVLWLPRIRAGGWMAFHDCTPYPNENVVPAVSAIQALMSLEKIDQIGSLAVFRVRPELWK